jgi:RNA polymerase sigma-70 factor (ECF subfamily)
VIAPERLHAARTAFPNVALGDDVFAAHVERHSVDGEPAHLEDLFLACACANGVDGALAAIERSFANDVAAAVRRFDASSAFADEVAQILRERLFVGAKPKIGDYSGRASLRSWIGAAAARAAINLRRRIGDKGHDALDSRVRGVAADGSVELQYMKRRYAKEFEAALGAALARLDPETRTLLRLHWSERVDYDKLAAMHRLSRATIARRLAAARATLSEETHRELLARLRVTASELESIAALVRSALELSVAKMLAT